ncbi:MAG: hypothetical protein ABIS29_19520 [Vicinamibacterales bacterium]
MDALSKVSAGGLDCHISVKLTQLGLDVDEASCLANLRALVTCANDQRTFIWIDMEQSR